MTLSQRPYAGAADFWRMRDLLIAAQAHLPVGLNWDVRRLDGQRFYNADPTFDSLRVRPVQLWEDAGDLVGFVLPEGRDDAHLQIHPDYRHLEAEMIAWAIAHLAATPLIIGSPRLHIYVMEYEALKQRLLAELGFQKTEWWGVIRRVRLGKQPLAEPRLAPGYTLRCTRPEDLGDCQAVADLLNAAFNRDFHNAAEYQNFARHAPCFRQQLDLAAVAADGQFAAYVGIPYDETNRRGIFEPVCTHPDHRQKGLAQALMQEGLLRLRALGAVEATVDTGDMLPANRLYDSLGFTEAYRGWTWRKEC